MSGPRGCQTRNVRDVARIVKEAFYISSTGRPGPVVIDVPKDVQQAEHVFKYPERVELRGYKPTLKGNPRQIERAIEAIDRIASSVRMLADESRKTGRSMLQCALESTL